jgi:hypothetical protein
MIDLAPSEAFLHTLPQPWNMFYGHAAMQGAATLSGILKLLAKEAGVPADQIDLRRLEFLPEARRLAEQWLERERPPKGSWNTTSQLERLFLQYAISVARMQSAIDDAAMNSTPAGSVH